MSCNVVFKHFIFIIKSRIKIKNLKKTFEIVFIFSSLQFYNFKTSNILKLDITL